NAPARRKTAHRRAAGRRAPRRGRSSRPLPATGVGVVPTVTLVANSAGAQGTLDISFAEGLILPRVRLGDPRREFATSVNSRVTSRPVDPRAARCRRAPVIHA